MQKKLLFNNAEFHLSEQDLPCLIHGQDKAGASLFTVSLVADLYLQGAKVLFLSGYHMARDEFVSQTEDPKNTIFVENENALQEAAVKRTIFVPREKVDLFIKAVHSLSDITERVILIKNIELFDPVVYDAIKDMDKLILSGDLDKCPYKEQIQAKSFNTKIVFSQPTIDIGLTLPSLEKYHGYLWSSNKQGVVSLQT